MDGSIGFESEPGRGSRFWVDLRSSAAVPDADVAETKGAAGESGED